MSAKPPAPPTSGAAGAPDSQALLLAICALLVEQREHELGGRARPATEVLLSDAGLSNATIAALVRKKPGSVRMALSRAKRDAAAPDAQAEAGDDD